MNNEDAIRILPRALPVLDRAARVEAVHSPELRASIRSGVKEYKAAVKFITKALQTRES